LLRKLVFLVLFLMVAIEPWEGITAISQIASLSRILGFVGVGCALMALAGTARMRRPPAPWIVLVLFTAWSAASVAWSRDPSISLARSFTYAMLLTLSWMIWEFAPSLGRLQLLLAANWLGCCATLMAQLAGFHSLTSGPGAELEGGKRFIAEATDPNGLGGHFALSIVIAFYFASNPKLRIRSRPLTIALWGYMLAATVGVFLTGSRGAVLSLACAIFTILVALRRVKWTTVVMFLACAVAARYIVPSLMSDYLTQRLWSGRESSSYKSRTELWVGGLTTWLGCPLQGTGAGTYRIAADEAIGVAMVAHNTYISVLVENGLIGLALFSVPWVLVVLRMRRLPPQEKLLCFGLLFSQIPIWVSGSDEYTKSLWILFGLFLSFEAAFRGRRVKGAAAHPLRPRPLQPQLRPQPLRPRPPQPQPQPRTAYGALYNNPRNAQGPNAD
jgi:O-antigen ligase